MNMWSMQVIVSWAVSRRLDNVAWSYCSFWASRWAPSNYCYSWWYLVKRFLRSSFSYFKLFSIIAYSSFSEITFNSTWSIVYWNISYDICCGKTSEKMASRTKQHKWTLNGLREKELCSSLRFFYIISVNLNEFELNEFFKNKKSILINILV